MSQRRGDGGAARSESESEQCSHDEESETDVPTAVVSKGRSAMNSLENTYAERGPGANSATEDEDEGEEDVDREEHEQEDEEGDDFEGTDDESSSKSGRKFHRRKKYAHDLWILHKMWDAGVLGQGKVDEEVFEMAKKLMTDVNYKVPITSVKSKDLGNWCTHFDVYLVLIFVFEQASGSTTSCTKPRTEQHQLACTCALSVADVGAVRCCGYRLRGTM